MNTQQKLSIPWSSGVFALLAVLSFTSTPALANSISPSLTLATDYRAESTYLNEWGTSALYDPRWGNRFQLGLGGQIALSKQDLEFLSYKLEPTFLLQDWFEGHLRFSRKVFISHTSGFTTALLFIKLQSPRLLSFRLFSKLGWYYRFWEVDRTSVIPIILSTPHLDYDFALALGLEYQPENAFFGKVTVATFDEMDIFNLNHPYGELLGGIYLTDFWTASVFWRYQISLGFGRLDRMVFGVLIDFVLDRYWEHDV